jgi:septal ring factor EnvC (AmiA/AmiB activator)
MYAFLAATFHKYVYVLDYKTICGQVVYLSIPVYWAWIEMMFRGQTRVRQMDVDVTCLQYDTADLKKREQRRIGQTKKTTRDVYKRIKDAHNRIDTLQKKVTEPALDQALCRRLEELTKNDDAMKKQIDMVKAQVRQFWDELSERVRAVEHEMTLTVEVPAATVDVDMKDSESTAE